MFAELIMFLVVQNCINFSLTGNGSFIQLAKCIEIVCSMQH